MTKENLRSFLGWCTVIKPRIPFILDYRFCLCPRFRIQDTQLVVRDIQRELCRNQLRHDGLLQAGGDSFQRDPVLGTQVRKVCRANEYRKRISPPSFSFTVPLESLEIDLAWSCSGGLILLT